MQTILGAGGAIGVELAKSLTGYTKDIRLVGRNPKKVNESDSLFKADVSNKAELIKAVEGSEVVYLTVGFDYNAKLWQEKWPPLIKNTIEACLATNAKLVFFDNVYAIGRDHVHHITEGSPMSPSSKKGEVRAQVDNLIMDAVDKRNLNAIIARSADFFSEMPDKSIMMNTVYNQLKKGKKAQWFCNAKVVHSCSYAPDLGKGTAMLGNTPDAFNQIWNLPTDDEKITGEGWINLFAKEMNTGNKYQVLPSFGFLLLGLFVPIMREMYEMRYQYDRDYFFDSSKFNKRFNYSPTKNAEAVKRTVERLRSL
jgi:nucleoside-diphosphate-sugar epimerase